MAQNVNIQYDYLFRIAVIGDTGVGKSNLLSKFARNEFVQAYVPTIGIDFAPKVVTLDDKNIRLNIWDTSGQDRFLSITISYFRGANGFMLVYDVTSYSSYINTTWWLKQLRVNAKPDCVVMLVGNKTDLNHLREVTIDEARNFAAEHGFTFLETSALGASNVEDAFQTLVRDVYYTIAGSLHQDSSENTSKEGRSTRKSGRYCWQKR